MTTLPQTKWEALVDKAMKTCAGQYGDGLDADGVPKMFYTHIGGEQFPVDGIFEAVTEGVDPDTGVSINVHQPFLNLPRSALLQDPRRGDLCTIRGKNYTVLEPEFDGQGTVTLRLHEV